MLVGLDDLLVSWWVCFPEFGWHRFLVAGLLWWVCLGFGTVCGL